MRRLALVEGEDDERTGGGACGRSWSTKRRASARSRSRSDMVTIGRLADCDVVLKDKGASRKHAQLKTARRRAGRSPTWDPPTGRG